MSSKAVAVAMVAAACLVPPCLGFGIGSGPMLRPWRGIHTQTLGHRGAVVWHTPSPPASQPLAPSLFPALARPAASRRACAAGLSMAAGSGEGLSRLVDLKGRRYILVGGKGGVGKTSTSSAIAIKLADEGLRTLVISTDPAHSLGDALMTDLSSGKVTPVAEQGGMLYALEIDLDDAIEEFKRIISGLSGGDDKGNSIADKLGLGGLTDIFDNPPPGADELVALSKVVSLVEEGEAKTAMGESIKFDRVVIDTAPTGHTMRLLDYPGFIESLLTKALNLRGKIDMPMDVVGQAGSFFASQLGIKMPDEETVKKGGSKVRQQAEKFRDRMAMFDDLLHDPERAEFVVVSIATGLSQAETQRLLPMLRISEVSVRHLVVNQLVKSEEDGGAYLNRLYSEQQRCLKTIRESPSLGKLALTEVPRFDMEVVGVYGLRALGMAAFGQDKRGAYGPLFDASRKGQFVFVGGKGGVGKTSTSSALGVALADEGLRTLIISTDPAHSLGDALGVPLTGEPKEIEGTGGMLSAMEVDTDASMEEFKSALRGVTSISSKFGDLAAKIGLDEFAEILESPPPGVDEVVSLGKVMNLMKDSKYDRIIVDTAPTGHTLRLLALPDFVENFLQKVLDIKGRIDGALNLAKSVFGLKGFVSGDSNRDDIEDAAVAVKRLRDQSIEVRDMLHDQDSCQFLIVTIPTALAMLESQRLAEELQTKGVAVRGAIVNQVMSEAPGEGYAGRLVKSQGACLEGLKSAADKASVAAADTTGPVTVTEVPYFDTELRSVYGLRVLGKELFE